MDVLFPAFSLAVENTDGAWADAVVGGAGSVCAMAHEAAVAIAAQAEIHRMAALLEMVVA
jgi:hypothetical protein